MARKIQTKYAKTSNQVSVADATRTAIYVRVSTELQKREGNSLEAQQEKLLGHCAAKGWAVAPEHIYIDAGISGKSDDRPAFQAMLTAAKAGEINRIVVTKRDRFARNTVDFLTRLDELMKLNCSLVCLDFDFDSSTPTGKLVTTVFAGFAEWEASLITDRVMTGKRQNAQKAGFNGAPVAYGYERVNGQFIIDEAKAQVVRRIFAYFNGGNSILSIVNALNAEGIPSPTGKHWNSVTTKHILSNGIYCGLMQWAGTEKQADHPAIVTAEVYEAATARFGTLQRGNPSFVKAA